MEKTGALTQLTLAWSRDGVEKVYVQHRIREQGEELRRWLEDGAHFYVCGDAKNMAKEVELALVDVIATFGLRSTEAAKAFVSGLLKKPESFGASALTQTEASGRSASLSKMAFADFVQTKGLAALL
jgi:sulfite reductase alpha subunit-like flavoprotein